MTGRRSLSLLVAWSAALVACLWFLHGAGGSELAAPPLLSPTDLATWPARVGSANAVVAIIRLLALGLAWYLTLATIVGSLVRVVDTPGLQRSIDQVTPGFLRALLGSAGTITAAGLTLAVSPLVAPTTSPLETHPAAASQPSIDAAVEPGTTTVPGSPATMTRVEAATLEMLAPLEMSRPGQTSDDGLTIASVIPLAQPSDRWTVETGDHFWGIALEVLGDSWGRTPGDHEVGPYWSELIEANRHRLVAPENPDLIYPGQVMTLPPVPADPVA